MKVTSFYETNISLTPKLDGNAGKGNDKLPKYDTDTSL